MESKTIGYKNYGDRPSCDGCKFSKWVGSGSKSQQEFMCTKLETPFVVGVDDCCDEFECDSDYIPSKANLLKTIEENHPDLEFLKADGFDLAVIGWTTIMETGAVKLIYDVEKCLQILVRDSSMSSEDAREYFDFNVSGAHMGEKTPIWVETPS